MAMTAMSMGGLNPSQLRAERTSRTKLPVAAIVTEYRENSHADVIIGKILDGYEQDGGAGPDLTVASMFTDQVPENDMSRELAKKHGFPMFETIEEAITLGGDNVAVAGVLNIGEHGKYPNTPDTDQIMYPRRRFFDETVETFRRYGKVVPVFNDKHLSHNWKDAKHMYDTAQEMAIPFMAGSSLPVAWRVPPITLPMGCEIEQALALGYGPLESYGFHALETLQCMVERRNGGESGVVSVQAVQGDDVWQAERDGLWSRELLQAAVDPQSHARIDNLEDKWSKNDAVYLIEYRDGLRAAVAMASGVAARFAFAARLKGQPKPVATWFRLQDGKPYGHFGYLVQANEHMIHAGRPAYPVERTLLTTGVLDTAMHSLAANHRRLETPFLDVQYEAVDWPFPSGVPDPPRKT